MPTLQYLPLLIIRNRPIDCAEKKLRNSEVHQYRHRWKQEPRFLHAKNAAVQMPWKVWKIFIKRSQLPVPVGDSNELIAPEVCGIEDLQNVYFSHCVST